MQSCSTSYTMLTVTCCRSECCTPSGLDFEAAGRSNIPYCLPSTVFKASRHRKYDMDAPGFHRKGWRPWNPPFPQISWNWVWLLLWLVCVIWKVCPRCVRSNLRGFNFPGGDMPPDPPSSHACLRTLLSSCCHPAFIAPQLKILYETLAALSWLNAETLERVPTPSLTVW